MRNEIPDRVLDKARSEARDEALRDSDSFAEWLSCCCIAAPVARVLPYMTLDSVTRYFETGATEAELLAIAIEPGQKAEVRCAAMDQLTARYCATPTISKWIDGRAAELVPELDDDDRFPEAA